MLSNTQVLLLSSLRCCTPSLSSLYRYYWFQDSTKRLEQLFGILRSMRRGNLNFDALDLRDRIVDSCGIAQIYAKNPEWDTAPRRLSTSFDRKNPRSWQGCVDVRLVEEPECWKNGWTRAHQVLDLSNVYSAPELDISSIVLADNNVDMLRPKGETIGVLAGDGNE